MTCQAPLPMGFSRQEHWSGLPSPSPKGTVERKKVKSLSRVRLFATPWTIAYQAPPSMEFSSFHGTPSIGVGCHWSEYWRGMGECLIPFRWIYLSFFPLPFVSLLFSAICKASSDNRFAFLHFFFLGMVLITASCTMSEPPSIVLQALCLSDLIPWNYLSLPLFSCKGFDLVHTWMV